MNHHSKLHAESRRHDDHDALAAPRVIDAPTMLRLLTPTNQTQAKETVQLPPLGATEFLASAFVVVSVGLIAGFGIPLLLEAFLIAVDALTGGSIQ